jgi:S1-C subfamily serine protease
MNMNPTPKPANRTLITCGIVAAVLICLGIGAGAVWLLLRAFQETAVPPTPPPAVQIKPTLQDTPAPLPTRAPTRPPEPLGEIPYQAVVQILTLIEIDGQTEFGWSGSGSIISPDGFILTNAHVVLSDRFYEVKDLVVAITVAQDAPPEPRYRMQLLQVDEALDIAVGRIIADQDGNPIDPATLNLPTVPLGNSDELNLGDTLTILGYPGIGGETITLTRGEVSGFTFDPAYGNRGFIKTSATIAGGNSGGLAANSRGEIIGVPTQLGYGGRDQYVDCRVLADTNRDGLVNENDSCVPTGGFINSLRPLTLALPLIEAAQRGEININTGVQASGEEIPPNAVVLFSDDFSDPNSGWNDSADSDTSVGYVDEAYQISVYTPNYFTWSYRDPSYEDVVIQVDALVLQSVGDGDYGLICRYQDENNFYGLEISEDSYFTIYKYIDGEFISLYDWEYSDLIRPGELNTVKIACIGPKLAVGVGETVLAVVEDYSLASGKVGLVAGTFDQSGLTVEFDNFTIYQP